MHDAVLATSADDQIRQEILSGYNKDVHPSNEVRLTYQLVYLECPIPDPRTGNLVSTLHERQVGYARQRFQAKAQLLLSYLSSSSSPPQTTAAAFIDVKNVFTFFILVTLFTCLTYFISSTFLFIKNVDKTLCK